jgi:hypothetical protein
MNWNKTTRKLMGRKSTSSKWTTGLVYAALTGAAIWGVTALIRRMGSRTEEPTGEET